MILSVRTLVTFFDRLFTDPCSTFVVGLVAHVLAFQLLAAAEDDERNRRWGFFAGVGSFFLLTYAEFLRRGPDWFSILALAGLRAWIVASLAQMVFSVLSLLFTGIVSPLLFRWRHYRKSRAHAKYHARIIRERQTAPPTDVPASASPPAPPPPTFESEVSDLLARFDKLREAILKLPIPADEQQARINFLKDKLNEQIDQLTERYCT